MTVESGVRLMAGTMVLISLALGRWVHPYWLFLAVFVGVNLVQSSFTGLCPACTIMRKLGCREGGACPTCKT